VKSNSPAYAIATRLPARHGASARWTNTGHGSTHQTNESPNGTNTNMDYTPDWTTAVAANTTALGYISQWGANANTPLCESCHNILRNGVEGARGLTRGWRPTSCSLPTRTTTSARTPAPPRRERLLRRFDPGRCQDGRELLPRLPPRRRHHGPANFVHNPEAHTVPSGTYAYAAGTAPYGRSTTTILTDEAAGCPNRSTADATTSPNAVSYPGANQVDCDSCHRAHNADPDSLDTTNNRHLILEVTDTNWGTTICAECHNTDTQCN